jgi:opacity protein-like surface antigen
MRSLLATAAFAASIGAASAADLGGHVLPSLPPVPAVLAPSTSWTGCYFGGAGGYAVSTLPLAATYDGYEFFSADMGGEGATLGLTGGCDLQLGKVVVGGFGDYTWHFDHESKIVAFEDYGIRAHLDAQWAAGGRAGVLINDGTLLYGLAGYTETDGDYGKAKGIMWGGGLEVAIGSGFSLRGEYRYSDIEDETQRIGDVVVKGDPDIHEVRAALTYKIGVGR